MGAQWVGGSELLMLVTYPWVERGRHCLCVNCQCGLVAVVFTFVIVSRARILLTSDILVRHDECALCVEYAYECDWKFVKQEQQYITLRRPVDARERCYHLKAARVKSRGSPCSPSGLAHRQKFYKTLQACTSPRLPLKHTTLARYVSHIFFTPAHEQQIL